MTSIIQPYIHRFNVTIIKRWSLLTYVPQAPYAPSCLRALLTRLIYEPCAPFSRALLVICALLNLFRMDLQSRRNFPFSKDYQRHYKPCCFYADQKTAVILFKQGNLLSILKREINSMFLCFSFHFFSHEVIVINFLA